jgi:hypothetical protein
MDKITLIYMADMAIIARSMSMKVNRILGNAFLVKLASSKII